MVDIGHEAVLANIWTINSWAFAGSSFLVSRERIVYVKMEPVRACDETGPESEF